MNRVLDSQSRARRFDSQSLKIHTTTLIQLFTNMSMSLNSIMWYWLKYAVMLCGWNVNSQLGIK